MWFGLGGKQGRRKSPSLGDDNVVEGLALVAEAREADLDDHLPESRCHANGGAE